MVNNKYKALQVMQKHGDIAFMQGYKAALNDIPLDDYTSLLNMEEALARILLMQDVVRLLEIKHEDMG